MTATAPRIHRSPLEPFELPTPVEKRRPGLDNVATALGLLTLGGLHAAPGLQAVAPPRDGTVLMLATALWTVTAASYGSAAYGFIGLGFFGRRWRILALGAGTCGLILIALAGFPSHGVLAAFDVLAMLFAIVSPTMLEDLRPLRRFWQGIAMLVLIYGAAVPLLYPWMQRWGATEAEMARSYSGEPGLGERPYFVDHVVDVQAPPERVWPWLVQVGQDRGGFYSYDALERLFGLEIRNVSQIRPEWQTLRSGDFIRACPPEWLGGRWRDVTGWKVTRVEPSREIALEHWGVFWVRPNGTGRSRLGVRSEIEEVPSWYAPIHAYVFIPIHFTMEQRMLRTIRDLSGEHVPSL